jgi:hypothetical protein
MADAVSDRLQLLDAEVAKVSEKLEKIYAELLDARLPSAKRLKQLELLQQMLVKEKESLYERRGRLEAAIATGAPSCARACTLAACKL